jgi:hypothetical protein
MLRINNTAKAWNIFKAYFPVVSKWQVKYWLGLLPEQTAT